MTQIPLQSRFKQDFFRFRYGTGSYVSGRYVDGTVSVSAYKGSIQPMVGLKGGEQLQNLPEGMRTRKWIVCYTYPDTLRTGSEEPANIKADIIYFNGEAFEVQKVNRWTGQILTHDEVWAVETPMQVIGGQGSTDNAVQTFDGA